MAFVAALRALNDIKTDGVIEDYAGTRPDLRPGRVRASAWASNRPPTQFVPAPRSDPRDVAFPTVDLLQRIVLPLIARQRPLRSWERVWEIDP